MSMPYAKEPHNTSTHDVTRIVSHEAFYDSPRLLNVLNAWQSCTLIFTAICMQETAGNSSGDLIGHVIYMLHCAGEPQRMTCTDECMCRADTGTSRF